MSKLEIYNFALIRFLQTSQGNKYCCTFELPCLAQSFLVAKLLPMRAQKFIA
jgi:hypothetical protein